MRLCRSGTHLLRLIDHAWEILDDKLKGRELRGKREARRPDPATDVHNKRLRGQRVPRVSCRRVHQRKYHRETGLQTFEDGIRRLQCLDSLHADTKAVVPELFALIVLP